MNSKIDIKPEHLKIVHNILLQHLPAHSKVWVFGSRAKGNAKKFSDLDLVIDAGKSLPGQTMTNLAFDFEESDLPYRVDIVDWNTISDNFKKIIIDSRVEITLNLKT